MDWVLFGAIAFGVMAVGVVVILALRFTGPRVAQEQVAEADLDLVREADRARWRRKRLRSYRREKCQDDFFRLAAYRKAIAGGAAEADVRARLRREFPFYYLNPAERDAAGYDGEDGNLPVVLRERVDRSARVLKPLMESEGERFRTMNALVRTCIRKGAI